LTGNAPYSKYDSTAILEKIRLGELPQKPPGIDDTVWDFLRKCWSRDPTKRPSTAQVCEAFSELRSLPKFTSDGQSTTDLPGKVKLKVQSIKVSFEKSKQHQFSVKLKYGNKDHTTSPTKPLDSSGEHTWFALCLFLLPAITKLLTGTVRKAGRSRRIDGIMDKLSP